MVPDDLVLFFFVFFLFFLSSTCMTVIWNSTIIRTARKRGLGSCLLELPCQYFYPLSLVSCRLELSFLSFSLFHDPLFYSFYRFLQYFLFTYFFSMFHHFHYLLFNLSQKHKFTHTHTQVPIQALCLGAVWLGCLCVWLIFSYSTILPHARTGNHFPVCFSFWPTLHQN